jgi:hypothetical protein
MDFLRRIDLALYRWWARRLDRDFARWLSRQR